MLSLHLMNKQEMVMHAIIGRGEATAEYDQVRFSTEFHGLGTNSEASNQAASAIEQKFLQCYGSLVSRVTIVLRAIVKSCVRRKV